jgi:hypothetical protein
MYGNTTSNIGYKGVVTIRKKIGNQVFDKKIYNQGAPKLFEILCRAIVGYDISKFVPSYVDIKKLDGDSVLSIRNVKLYGGRYENTDTTTDNSSPSWKATFSFSLTKQLFIENSISSGEKYSIIMYGRNDDKLASISVDGEDLMITGSTSLIVDWDMVFQNNNDNDEIINQEDKEIQQ